jgi:hypothetical protein
MEAPQGGSSPPRPKQRRHGVDVSVASRAGLSRAAKNIGARFKARLVSEA